MANAQIQVFKEAIAETVLVTHAKNKDLAWSSWIFDFRALLLQPEWLNAYAELFWETYKDKYPFQVCGMETAGIPLVAAIVMKGVERGAPVNGLYVRKSRKREGLFKNLEGTPTTDPVILVDDLINSGQSFKKQTAVLADRKLVVTDVFALMRFRDEGFYETFRENSITLTTFFTLADFGVTYDARSKDYFRNETYYKERWRISYAHPWLEVVGGKSGLVTDGTQLYVGSDAGVLFCFNQTSGDTKWTFGQERRVRDQAMLSRPVVHKDRLYVGSVTGCVSALSRETGSKVWSYDDGDWVGGAPAVAEKRGLLFAGIEYGLWRKRGALVALRLADGTPQWKKTAVGAFRAGPLYVAENDVVVAATDDGVVCCCNAKNGEEVWVQKVKGVVHASFAYDTVSRLLFFGTSEGILYAVAIDTGLTQWNVFALGIFSTPVIKEGVVYFTSVDKCVYAVDIKTGAERWKFATRGRIFCSPVLRGNSLFVGSNDGGLYEFDCRTGRVLSFFQASERIVNPPVWDEATGIMYLPTQAHQIYALERVAEQGKVDDTTVT